MQAFIKGVSPHMYVSTIQINVFAVFANNTLVFIIESVHRWSSLIYFMILLNKQWCSTW